MTQQRREQGTCLMGSHMNSGICWCACCYPLHIVQHNFSMLIESQHDAIVVPAFLIYAIMFELRLAALLMGFQAKLQCLHILHVHLRSSGIQWTFQLH